MTFLEHNQSVRGKIADEIWEKARNGEEIDLGYWKHNFFQDFVCIKCGKLLTISNLKFQHWKIESAKCFNCQWN